MLVSLGLRHSIWSKFHLCTAHYDTSSTTTTATDTTIPSPLLLHSAVTEVLDCIPAVSGWESVDTLGKSPAHDGGDKHPMTLTLTNDSELPTSCNVLDLVGAAKVQNSLRKTLDLEPVSFGVRGDR